MTHHPLQATLAPLLPFRGECNVSAIIQESRKIWRLILRSEHWNTIRKNIREASRSGKLETRSTSLDGEAIEARLASPEHTAILQDLCRSLISWRVGPYQLGDLYLDTEWRSFKKWERIRPLLPQTAGMRIADIGCSNGYFLFKLSTLNPEIAIGFDPIERCWLQFALIQSLVRTPNLAFVPMGILSLEAFQGFFDFILCMGVLYHQRDHALAVRRLFDATRSGGYVLLESLIVPSDKPLVIEPRDRYAKMRNAWVIPSANHLHTLFEEAGFTEVSVHSFGPLTTNEQRATKFAPYESLADFLDPNDPTRTIEGHPAPHTAAVIGKKV